MKVAGTPDKIDFAKEKANLPNIGEDKEKHIYPRVEICSWIHKICRRGVENEPDLTARLLTYIEKNDLAHLYKYISDKGIIVLDPVKYEKMIEKDSKIRSSLLKMMETIKSYDELAVREVADYYSNYLSFMGDKEESLQYLKNNYNESLTITNKIENLLHQCRIGFFFLDRKLVNDSLQLVDRLIKKSSDWHLKNITYAYTALYSVWNRDISAASSNFLICVSSFTSFDLMPLTSFCAYTTITSLLVLSRDKFYQKIINGPEVQEGLYNAPVVSNLAEAFYTCDYREFTKSLKILIGEMLNDPFCNEHADYLCSQFRLKAYIQLLASFKSLTLEYLSEVFGLGSDFIEADIARFIAKGLLNCKIDLVRGMIVISHSDKKKKEFNRFLEESDRLIADVQYMERTYVFFELMRFDLYAKPNATQFLS
ncbi:hypothetical protein HZS_5930, partial [Henneguya salminicola]